MNIKRLAELSKEIVKELNPATWESFDIGILQIGANPMHKDYNPKVIVSLYHTLFFKMFLGSKVDVVKNYCQIYDYYFKMVDGVLFQCMLKKKKIDPSIREAFPREHTIKKTSLRNTDAQRRKWA